MPDSYEEIAVAGILQNPARIGLVADRFGKDHFRDPLSRSIFILLRQYFVRSGRSRYMDRALLSHHLKKGDPSPLRSNLLARVMSLAGLRRYTDAEFEYSIHIITRAYRVEILRRGTYEATQAIIDGEVEEAETQLEAALAKSRGAEGGAAVPTNPFPDDIVAREKARLEVIADSDDEANPLRFGFEVLDSATTARRKHQTIIAGYTGDGKTQTAGNISYTNIATPHNGLFISLEMTEDEIRALVAARHAAEIGRPFLWADAVSGNMEDDEKARYLAALEGVRRLPGKLFVWAPEDRPRWSQVVSHVRATMTEVPLSFVVIDYLELVDPDESQRQYRLAVKWVAEAGKALARKYNVWVIMLHQISRSGRENAEKRTPKRYILRDLGESAGVERAADEIVTVYSDEELERDREVAISLPKARFGKKVKVARAFADYARGTMGDLRDSDFDEPG